MEVLRERQIEGLLITTTNLRGATLKGLLEDGFPFVLLYSTVRKGPMSSVGVDNFSGGYCATEHLKEAVSQPVHKMLETALVVRESTTKAHEKRRAAAGHC